MSSSLRTHQEISTQLCGVVVSQGAGQAEVRLPLRAEMQVDATGLVHGGFTFGGADLAAMACVNEPTVVLTAADVAFLRPSRVGDTLLFRARVVESDGKTHRVEVIGSREDVPMFRGHFVCVVPGRHVLANR